MSDQQLLRSYAQHRSEPAFTALVRRHVDLVYSAALRMVGDAHLAEDVTQCTFVALAQNTIQLSGRLVLSGWLHRTAQNMASKSVRSDIRRRAREQEAAAMNELLAVEPDATWEHIAPHLDAALGELSEPDRDALLLRYFERKSAREMAQALGTTEDAAQRRVSRAVERLRQFFAQRGVTVGASGLVVALSANAVQAAPAGLAVTISAAAATLVGTSIPIAATVTKAIAMTTLQKTLIVATLAATVGTGIYEARQASTLRTQTQKLQQQQAPLAEQNERLSRERDDATAREVALQQENERLRQTAADVPKLRGELARLRGREHPLAQSKSASHNLKDPFTQNVLALTDRATELNQHLERMPDKKIPELQLLTESDWLLAAKDAKFDAEVDVRKALSHLRSLAKSRLPMGGALNAFTRANNGQLPTDLSQLKPYYMSDPGNKAA